MIHTTPSQFGVGSPKYRFDITTKVSVARSGNPTISQHQIRPNMNTLAQRRRRK
jgi:hypothetical protein